MSTSVPADQKLYDKIKTNYQNKMKNSAYRSGLIVKSYEKAFAQKHGNGSAYIYKKRSIARSGSKMANARTKIKSKNQRARSITRSGSKSNSKTNRKDKGSGLNRWFAEQWRNESGKIGYDKNNHLYRPTKRINSRTPKTWSELSKFAISRAEKEKKTYGRVKKF